LCRNGNSFVHVWMAPVLQGRFVRFWWVSLAVMCPAFGAVVDRRP
jgi:hypothetical protein